MSQEHYSFAVHEWYQSLLVAILVVSSVSAAAFLAWRIFTRPVRFREMAMRLESSPWTPNHAGLVLCCLLFGMSIMILLFGAAARAGRDIDSAPAYLGLALSVAFFHLPGLVGILLISRKGNISLADGFGFERRLFGRNVLQGAIFALGILPLVVGVAAMYDPLLRHFGVEGDLQPALRMILDAAQAPWFARLSVGILAIVVVPAIEELVFRGILFPVVAKKIGMIPAILAVSLTFAILHQDVPTYAPLFVLSTGLCMAYAYSSSIIVPILMHSTFNLIQIALLSLVDIR